MKFIDKGFLLNLLYKALDSGKNFKQFREFLEDTLSEPDSYDFESQRIEETVTLMALISEDDLSFRTNRLWSGLEMLLTVYSKGCEPSKMELLCFFEKIRIDEILAKFGAEHIKKKKAIEMIMSIWPPFQVDYKEVASWVESSKLEID